MSVAATVAGWVFPLQTYTITQRFGVQNGHDAGGHPGVDMAAPLGTPVIAPHDGTVSYEGPASGFGNNYVTVDVGGGLEADFGHMKAAYVKAGQTVHAGQIIGLVGSEGQSTGPHLHFQLKQSGRLIDPLAYLQGHGAVTASGVQLVGDTTGGDNSGGGSSWNPFPGGNWDPLNWVPNAAGQTVSDVAGAVSTAFEGLAHSLWVTAVKGVLIVGGAALVVTGLHHTAKQTQTYQNVQAKASQAAQVAAMAA